MRGFDEKGDWAKKQKSVFANSRNADGKAIYDPTLPSYDPKDKAGTTQYRIPALDKDGNQKTRVREGKGTEYLWEKVSIPANDWNDHSKVEKWRASWAEHCNRYLKPENKIDHRSYERQGLDKEPTIHEGVTARQMEKEGAVSDRCEYNRGVRERNSLRAKLAELLKEIIELVKGRLMRKEDIDNERARKFMERRRTSARTGIHTGRDRGSAGRESAEVIRNIRASIDAATSSEENSRAEQSYREAEQRRLDSERQREAAIRSYRSKDRGIDR